MTGRLQRLKNWAICDKRELDIGADPAIKEENKHGREPTMENASKEEQTMKRASKEEGKSCREQSGKRASNGESKQGREQIIQRASKEENKHGREQAMKRASNEEKAILSGACAACQHSLVGAQVDGGGTLRGCPRVWVLGY